MEALREVVAKEAVAKITLEQFQAVSQIWDG